MTGKRRCAGLFVITSVLFMSLLYHQNELSENIIIASDRPVKVDTKPELFQETHDAIKPAGKRTYEFELQNFTQFFDYVENPNKKCENEKVFGGIYSVSREHYFDGDKIVCLDEVFNISKEGCRVYSFGISNEWSFDDAIAKYGCYVYAFDPTMAKKYNPEIPNTVYKRGKKVYFFPIGLGGKDYSTMIGKKNCELRRMKTILEFLHHNRSDVIIDYVKIDIEGSELEFFEDLLYNTPELLNQIKQIGIEIHPKRAVKGRWKIFQDYYRYFMKLESLGFKLFNSRMNPISSTKYKSSRVGRVVNEFYEMVWGRFEPSKQI